MNLAEVLKAFGGRDITVQEARQVNRGPKKAGGADVMAYDVKMVPLKVAHIIGSRELNGRVTITTIDGKKHEAAWGGADA